MSFSKVLLLVSTLLCMINTYSLCLLGGYLSENKYLYFNSKTLKSEPNIDLIKKEADKGDPHAQYNLGCLHRIKSENQQAMDWFLKSAKQNEPAAMLELYLDASSVKNNGFAIDWLKKAADLGYVPAINRLAEYYYNNDQISKTIDIYLKLIDRDPSYEYAYTYLGILYYFGGNNDMGGDKPREEPVNEPRYKSIIDHKKAVRYFYQAASRDSQVGKYYFALMNYNGHGTPKDLKTAFEYFKDVADNYEGYTKLPYSAKVHVGKMYYYGEGTEKNLLHSYKYLKVPALAGDQEAYSYLDKVCSEKTWICASNSHDKKDSD